MISAKKARVGQKAPDFECEGVIAGAVQRNRHLLNLSV
jgi:hypothetical protein